MLDNTSGVPLFPLPEWNLVKGDKDAGLNAGLRLWTFVRHYTSDTFTTDGTGIQPACSFSNVVLTFVVGPLGQADCTMVPAATEEERCYGWRCVC